MKKTNSMRVAVAMLALTLITSCFVGGTFAKYTTSASGKDSARVAMFGVTVTAGDSAFAKAYKTHAELTEAEKLIVGGNSVVSSKDDKVVAPGTSGKIDLFTISGKPEVAVRITASMTNVKSVYLNYRLNDEIGFIPNVNDWEEGEEIDLPVIGMSDETLTYNPIRWTLMKDGQKVNDVTDNDYATLQDIAAWLNTNISGVYQANSDKLADEICGTYTLEWAWPFEVDGGKTDFLDTVLGDLAAGTITYTTENCLTEAFNFSITVTQID